MLAGAPSCDTASSIQESSSIYGGEAMVNCRSEGAVTTRVVINIISLLVGIVSVIGIILTPLWIVMLVRAIHHNNNHDRPMPPTLPTAV